MFKIAALVGISLLATQAMAQEYPNRPVTVVVAFAPGGSTDLFARALSQQLSEQTGQTFLVDNRPGAGGSIAAEHVRNAKPDGYTILVGTADMVVTPSLVAAATYLPSVDFEPLGRFAQVPMWLAARPDLPVDTIEDMVELAHAEPGRLNYAMPGVGTAGHLGMEIIKYQTKSDITSVPYSGAAPALVDLIAGRVDMIMVGPSNLTSYLDSGQLKVLSQPSGLNEQTNIPEMNWWYGALAPKGTPPEIVAKLNAEITKAMASEKVLGQLVTWHGDFSVSTPEEFRELLATDEARFASIIKEIGLTKQ